MKFFTPQLLERITSSDEDDSAEAHEEWEQAIIRYHRRWNKIKAAFPQEVQRFHDDHVCLHDAEVLRLGRQKDTFVFVLQQEPPSRDTVILLFTLSGEPEIDTTALPDLQGITFVTWMYEEFDLDRRKNFTFEVLLTNGWLVKLRFRDFRYWVVQQLLSTANGTSPQKASKSIPLPA